MKIILIICSLMSSFVFCTTLAFGLDKKTSVICPRADAFRVFAFDLIQKGDHPGVWTLTQSNHQYRTPHHWKFSVMVDAENQMRAARKAKQALSHLRKVRGPDKVDNVWVCDYDGQNILSAIAISR